MPQTAVNTPSPGAPESPDQCMRMMAAMRGSIEELLASGSLMVDTNEDNIPPRCNFEKREYSEVLRETEVCSIPDVHGDLKALKNSLETMRLIDSKGDWIGEGRIVQLLGDYIDRGPSNLDVLVYLMKLKKQAEAAGGQVRLLLGNHESLMLGAIAGYDEYRDLWRRPANGGGKTFDELARRYGISSEAETWAKMKRMFFDAGPLAELLKSTQLVSQVDDVLYIHGGLNAAWAEMIAQKGVDGVNQMWQEALTDLKQGKTEKFADVVQSDGPLWLRYQQHMQQMSDDEVARIAKALKSQGINAVVLGHDITFVAEMDDRFQKHGIKLIASDVEMSAGGSAGVSGIGGVQIDKQGNIEGHSRHGTSYLHQEAGAKQTAAA